MRILVFGARGEVGSTLSLALEQSGHSLVRVSSQVGIPNTIATGSACQLLESNSIDFVVNCSGPGDRRDPDRKGGEGTSQVAAAMASAGIFGVLVSTTRVMEGYDTSYGESDPVKPVSRYALANVAHEEAWLAAGGDFARVLRLTNYFAQPTSRASPQSQLLPWSLLTELWEKGSLEVRSAPSVVKEFVSAEGVAAAATVLALAGASAPVVCTSTPGFTGSLKTLVQACRTVVRSLGKPEPQVNFGDEASVVALCQIGFLAGQGWAEPLNQQRLREELTLWAQNNLLR